MSSIKSSLFHGQNKILYPVQIDNLKPECGDDFPEDVVCGLDVATTKISWESRARMLIWMGDAPSHGTDLTGLLPGTSIKLLIFYLEEGCTQSI